MLKTVANVFRKFGEVHQDSNLIIKRFAGHSKWQNIRHIKGTKDAERSMIFTKIGRQIRVAVQEGGSYDPKLNLKLSQVIDQAKRINMPAATVQSILKSCQNDKTQAKSHVFVIKGPGSCFILCQVFTSQLHVLKQNIATISKKHQSKLSDTGGLSLFEEKGIVEVEIPTEKSETKEELLETFTEHAIESGAEDVQIIDDEFAQFVCDKFSLNKVANALENLNYKIASASVEYIPLQLQALQESELEVCRKLYEKLQGLPDVISLADNIAEG